MAKAPGITILRAVDSQELDPAADPLAPDSIRHLVARYGSPLFIIDAGRVRAQYQRLAAALPGVDLHYAVKSLPHASVVDSTSATAGP